MTFLFSTIFIRWKQLALSWPPKIGALKGDIDS